MAMDIEKRRILTILRQEVLSEKKTVRPVRLFPYQYGVTGLRVDVLIIHAWRW